ncbi:polysaccharide deacetylase family protein [Paenibacillus typhae]|uniref:polysaccharide deacetylase family protein n=1 Tax=Paenibacillus typhae TaxID=1174501 RepID=UPI001C8EDC1E|nr:polysaccharide deacetylase family protein [Paenibacillus typhae]
MDLPGQEPISETYQNIEAGFDAVQEDVDAAVGVSEGIQAEVTEHKDSTAAHAAEHITYSGTVAGVTNLKDAVDNVQEQFNTVVVSGDSSPAADQARISSTGTTYPTLKSRLDTERDGLAAQLAEKAEQISTVKSNPSNYSGAVITFIDDDARTSFNTVWSDILTSKNIKIGIAVVKNFIGATGYLNLSAIQAYQDAGHDILNHSAAHAQAYTSIPIGNVEADVSVMVDYMEANGLKGSDVFVYPGGMVPQRVEVKDIVRKYCRYAINSANGQNVEPVDNWYVGRTFMDTMTLEQLKAAVDTAVANNSWLIFGSHSQILVDNTPSKVTDLIDYIQGLGVPILPFTEAEKIKGNSIAVGEYSQDNSAFISQAGKRKLGVNSLTTKVLTADSNTMDAPITDYPENSVTVKTLTLIGDTFKGIGGVMTVHRVKDNSYSYAIFTPNTESRVYKRRWNTTTGAWNAWTDIALADIRMVNSARQIFTVGSATPSVASGNYFLCNDTAANTITNFLGGTNGQIIYVGLNNTNTTIQNNANIKLQGGANFTGNKNDMIQLIYDTVTWKEVSRSNNVL